MWDQKQNNEVFSGRVTGPLRSHVSHDGNTRVPVPSDFSDKEYLVESSRKRKAVAMDHPGKAVSNAISKSHLGNHWRNESNDQNKFDVPSGKDGQGNTVSALSNITASSLQSDAKVLPREYGSEGLNLRINERNCPRVVEETDNLHSSTRRRASQQKEPSNLTKSTAGKIPTLLGPQSTSYNFGSQTEGHKPPYPDLTDTSADKALRGDDPSDSMMFGHTNHVLTGKSSVVSSLKTSERLSSEVSELNSKELNDEVNMNEKMFGEDILKNKPSSVMKQDGQSSRAVRTTGISTFRTSSLETASLEENVEESFQNCDSELTTAIPSNNGLASQVKLGDQNVKRQDIQVLEGKDGSHMVIGDHSLGADGSAKTSGSSTSVLTAKWHGNDSQRVALKLDGESKSHAEKANLITEKLWDGSLQLSASHTVSAVAFFKSGEKAPEAKWSKSIVVKGKVRLDAFEKFIQELPRSRSRGLTVTSLRWKAGSSRTGLAGMKEVAKGYKQDERVGFAQICPGIDLYVCPRSDAIITILAKYGFFKGMAALEEDQDSFIGCVVWRRNHSSDSVAKKSKNRSFPSSDKPLVSTANPVTLQTEKDNTPSMVSGERYTPLVSENCYGPLSVSESKSIQSSEVQAEVENSTSVISPEKTKPVLNITPAVSEGVNSSTVSVSRSQNSRTSQQIKTTTISRCEKPHIRLELLQPVRPVLAQTITTDNRPAPDDDDDDLPEFDFGAACGISQHSTAQSSLPSTSAHVSDAVPLVMKVPADVAKNVSGLMPSKLTATQLEVTVSQQRCQATTSRTVLGMNQPSNPVQKIAEVEALRPALSFPVVIPMAHGNEWSGQPGVSNQITSMALPARKNLWEDDMPEWCPPELESKGHPAMMSTARSSVPPVPSPVLDGLAGSPPTMSTMRPSSSYMSSPAVPNNKLPGPLWTMAAPRPSISHTSSALNNNIPGPTPTLATLWPSNSHIPPPVSGKRSDILPPCPPPIMATSNPSTPYLPPPILKPPPLPLVCPPPPFSLRPQFRAQGLPHGGPSSTIGARPPIGPNFPMGFTYNPTSRPQASTYDVSPLIRPAGWRGPRN